MDPLAAAVAALLAAVAALLAAVAALLAAVHQVAYLWVFFANSPPFLPLPVGLEIEYLVYTVRTKLEACRTSPVFLGHDREPSYLH
jgi:hypothetical protein